jgi:hypothetical protein
MNTISYLFALITENLEPLFCQYPNINKFETLMSSKLNKTIINVANSYTLPKKKRNA